MESVDAGIISYHQLSENQWRVHGTCVAHHDRATLFIGPAGSGKSRLAAEAIHLGGARLVADDQVVLELRDGVIYTSPVETIEGVLAVREHGLLKLEATHNVPLTTVISTVPLQGQRDKINVLGVAVPLICLSNAQVAQTVVEAFFKQADASGRVLPEDWAPQAA